MNLTQTLTLIAQQGPATAPNPLLQFMPFILLFAAMYFLIIAPQKKKQKLHMAMVESLKVGDRVMTSAGIYGAVTSVKTDRVTLQISDTSKVEVNKQYIANKIED